jgi:hypothetical protein
MALGAPTHLPSPHTEHPPGGVAGQGPWAKAIATKFKSIERKFMAAGR